MIRVLYTVASYLAATFVLLAVLEYGNLLTPPPSRYLTIHHLYVVTLVVGVSALWTYLHSGPPSRRNRTRQKIGLTLVAGLSLALIVSVIAVERLVDVHTDVLLFLYGTLAALGVVLALSRGRQSALMEFGEGRGSRLVHDRPFFVALAVVVGAMFVYHPAGLDDRSLGTLLFFSALIYYTHRTVLRRG